MPCLALVLLLAATPSSGSEVVTDEACHRALLQRRSQLENGKLVELDDQTPVSNDTNSNSTGNSTNSTKAKTVTTETVEAGETVLNVASQVGFAVGTHVMIDAGKPNEEAGEIVGFGSLLLKHPTIFAHPAGATIATVFKDKAESATWKYWVAAGEITEFSIFGATITGGTLKVLNALDLFFHRWHLDFWRSFPKEMNHVFNGKINKWDRYAISCILTWLIWMVLGLLIWLCFFADEFVPLIGPGDALNTFTHKPFDCLRTPLICCCSFCCPAVQWADTMRLFGFLPVWIGLALFYALALANSFVFGGIFFCGACTSLMIFIFRQSIRGRLGLKPWSFPGCCFDCFYVCCCPWCAIAQEAQVVRYARQAIWRSNAAPAFEPKMATAVGRAPAPPAAQQQLYKRPAPVSSDLLSGSLKPTEPDGNGPPAARHVRTVS